MPKSTTPKRNGQTKPPKPRPDFPLVAHSNGKWCKKINRKTHYFGTWSDPQGALEEYESFCESGRAPSNPRIVKALHELVNTFLASKRNEANTGFRSERTFVEYNSVCGMIIKHFGRDCLIAEIHPLEFEKLYFKWAEKYALATLGKMVVMTRTVFKYGWDNGLLVTPVKFGTVFRVPSQDELDKVRAEKKRKHGKKKFEADQIRRMLDAAGTQLKAMLLLSINGGLGNTDVASLPIQSLDLDGGWLDFARVKTGVERRIPLWPETIAALKEAIATRRKPVSEDDADLVFLTRFGLKWVRYSYSDVLRHGKTKVHAHQDDAVAKETAKLLKTLGLKRHGIGFYTMRHTFATVGGESKDQISVNFLMGHKDRSMAKRYRQEISDDRLRAVVDHVHRWLFPPAATTPAE